MCAYLLSRANVSTSFGYWYLLMRLRWLCVGEFRISRTIVAVRLGAMCNIAPSCSIFVQKCVGTAFPFRYVICSWFPVIMVVSWYRGVCSSGDLCGAKRKYGISFWQ